MIPWGLSSRREANTGQFSGICPTAPTTMSDSLLAASFIRIEGKKHESISGPLVWERGTTYRGKGARKDVAGSSDNEFPLFHSGSAWPGLCILMFLLTSSPDLLPPFPFPFLSPTTSSLPLLLKRVRKPQRHLMMSHHISAHCLGPKAW